MNFQWERASISFWHHLNEKRNSQESSKMTKRSRLSEIALCTYQEICLGTYFDEEGDEHPEFKQVVDTATINSVLFQPCEINKAFSVLRDDFTSQFNKKIDFWQVTTVQAIKRLGSLSNVKTGEIGALNFASATQIGGGAFNGAIAQEESLIRCSSLYLCLSQFDEDYYNYPVRKGVVNNNLIFSPCVPFYKDDTLSDAHWFSPVLVNVVTCAAVNAKFFKPKSKSAQQILCDIMRKRIRLVLRTFDMMECKHVILGAWGCGVFGNSVILMANLFREEIERHHALRDVYYHFAIPDIDTLMTFSSIFKITDPNLIQ